MQEELLASLESKNPSVKEETVRFLTRCFCKSTPAALPKTFLKPVCSSLLKVIPYETEPFITFVVFTSAFLFFYCQIEPSLAIMVLIQVPFFVSISKGTMTSNTLAVNKMNFKRLWLVPYMSDDDSPVYHLSHYGHYVIVWEVDSTIRAVTKISSCRVNTTSRRDSNS